MDLVKCGEGSSITQAGPVVLKKRRSNRPHPPTSHIYKGAKGRRVRGEGHPCEAVGVRWERVGEKEWESVDGFAYCSVKKRNECGKSGCVNTFVCRVDWMDTSRIQTSVVTCEYACLCTLYIGEPTARTDNFAAHTLE